LVHGQRREGERERERERGERREEEQERQTQEIERENELASFGAAMDNKRKREGTGPMRNNSVLKLLKTVSEGTESREKGRDQREERS